jgi:hypothetical protein
MNFLEFIMVLESRTRKDDTYGLQYYAIFVEQSIRAHQ